MQLLLTTFLTTVSGILIAVVPKLIMLWARNRQRSSRRTPNPVLSAPAGVQLGGILTPLRLKPPIAVMLLMGGLAAKMLVFDKEITYQHRDFTFVGWLTDLGSWLAATIIALSQWLVLIATAVLWPKKMTPEEPCQPEQLQEPVQIETAKPVDEREARQFMERLHQQRPKRL